MTSAPTTGMLGKPKLWVPGDWNAFFGFGTNILVNLLTLSALLAVRPADARRAGVQAHPARRRADDVHEHLLLRVARLSSGEEDRAQRRLRAALRDQRAAHVHRHAGHHAAGQARHRRSDEGLAGGADLGVHPELRADGRRLHCPHRPPDHAQGRAARRARRRLHHLHLHEARAGDVHDADGRRSSASRSFSSAGSAA